MPASSPVACNARCGRRVRRLLACLLLLALVASGTALADRGDPQRKITKADQARAKAMLLQRSDFPAAFKATSPGPDVEDSYCKALDESDLTLSGDAESKEFEGGLFFISSLAQVYATAADSNVSWRRGTSAAGMKCAGDIFRRDAARNRATLESFRKLAFPRLAEQSIAFRIVLSSEGIRIVVDAVVMKHGRAQAAVVLGSGLAPMPKAEEVRYARIVAGRMARAMRGG